MPMKLPRQPKFAKEVICSVMPVLWSLNHQAEPCWILPGNWLWKQPMMVPMEALSFGFKE